MTKHIVTGPAVVLPLESGTERYLYRGAELDSEGFTEAGIAHAIEIGLLSKATKAVQVEVSAPLIVETPAPADPAAPVEAPVEAPADPATPVARVKK